VGLTFGTVVGIELVGSRKHIGLMNQDFALYASTSPFTPRRRPLRLNVMGITTDAREMIFIRKIKT
jgi:hypothetical protein